MPVETLRFAGHGLSILRFEMTHDHGFTGRAAIDAGALQERRLLARAEQGDALGQQPAVDLDGLARDEARLVGYQERGHVGDHVRLAAVGPRLAPELRLVALRLAAMEQRGR